MVWKILGAPAKSSEYPRSALQDQADINSNSDGLGRRFVSVQALWGEKLPEKASKI